MDIQLYSDSYEEGEWFKSLDTRLSNSEIKSYNGNIPPIVESLLKYDNPDIILVVDDVPRLVVERTEQVPTGQNLGQRYARLVRAIELNVPAIYMFPFVKMKGGKNQSPCWANPWYFKTINRINSIHNSTLVPIRWPNNEEYYLKNGDIVDYEISRIMTEFINQNYHSLDFTLKKTEFRDMTFDKMNDMYSKSIENNYYWPNPPRSVTVLDTDEYIKNKDYKFKDKFKSRGETVIYKCGTSDYRCDPYTGMQFVYDYSLCRNGTHKSQKMKNFVIKLPEHNKSDWLERFGINTDTKGSLWYETANIIEFDDDILQL